MADNQPIQNAGGDDRQLPQRRDDNTPTPTPTTSTDPRPPELSNVKPAKPPAPKRRGTTWAQAFMVVCVTLIIAVASAMIASAMMLKSAVETPAKTMAAAATAAERFVQGLRSQTVTTTFIDYATTIKGTQRLQCAQLTRVEIVSRNEEKKVWRVTFPEVEVEARYPVTYTFYVDLKEQPWAFELRGDTLLVTAPTIETNEPAIDVSNIEYVTTKSSVWRRETSVQEALRGELTDIARSRAQNNIRLVRETSRREVEGFVRNWLLTIEGVLAQDQDDTAAPIHNIRVRFSDEEPWPQPDPQPSPGDDNQPLDESIS